MVTTRKTSFRFRVRVDRGRHDAEVARATTWNKAVRRADAIASRRRNGCFGIWIVDTKTYTSRPLISCYEKREVRRG